MIYPGGWHLSFFESIQRIKRKLSSYGHQNFAAQFVGNSTFHVNIDETGREVVPQSIPDSESLSESAIAMRVLCIIQTSKQQIDKLTNFRKVCNFRTVFNRRCVIGITHFRKIWRETLGNFGFSESV